MSAAALIAQAARAEVEAPPGSGLYWRVKKVVSADLAKSKIAALRMILPSAGKDPNDEAAAIKALNRIGDKELDHVNRVSGGVVCAGVTDVRLPGREWEPIKVVATEAERDAAGGLDAGVMCIPDLPATVETVLYEAIVNLHGDAKGAAESLARFCGGA